MSKEDNVCRHQNCEVPNPPAVCRKCGEWEGSGGVDSKLSGLLEAFSDLIESILDNVTIEYMDEMTEGKMSIATKTLDKYKDKT
jgi:hypothetical protein